MGLFDGSKIDKAIEKLEKLEAFLDKVQELDTKIDQVKEEYLQVKQVIKDFNIFSLFEGFDLKKWIATIASFLGIATASPFVSNVATDIVNTQLGVESVNNAELIQEIKNLKQELAALKATENTQQEVK